ncbi:MAG: hypothetical protein ABJ364_08595 [Lentilitoribacter sp.]
MTGLLQTKRYWWILISMIFAGICLSAAVYWLQNKEGYAFLMMRCCTTNIAFPNLMGDGNVVHELEDDYFVVKGMLIHDDWVFCHHCIIVFPQIVGDESPQHG